MLKIVLLFVIAVLVTHPVYAQDTLYLDPGSYAIVGNETWVEITNEEQIANSNVEFQHGDTCLLEFEGIVFVVTNIDNTVAVQYISPSVPGGTLCPNGAQFVLSKDEFYNMSEEYHTRANRIRLQKVQVAMLLSHEFYGETQAVEDQGWVEIANLEPVLQEYTNGYVPLFFGDSCFLHTGSIQVRGVNKDLILFEYTSSEVPMGTACPSGILFFW